MTDAQIAALSFEPALAKLEEIVAELETGKAELERSIDLYQVGARLKGHCQAKLNAAQLKVEQIVLGPSGPTGLTPAEFS